MKHNKSDRCRGVTLMEVVTSVGTIAVLSTLLLPALSDARRQGKEVHCLANLGRLADASLVYAAADASELTIPAHPQIGLSVTVLGEYEWGGKSGVGEPLTGTDISSSQWGTGEGRGPATRPLNRILYRDDFPDHRNGADQYYKNLLSDTELDLDVYRCPADSGYAGHHFLAWRNSKLTSYDHYGNSYTANALWIGVPGGQCKLSSNSSFLKPASRIPDPARTLLYVENCGRYGYRANYGGPNDGGCGPLNPPPSVETNIRGWHGRTWMFQAAFVDGHAGTVRMQGHQQPEPQLGRYPPFEARATPHHFWHCVILRGPGWQIDTLPSPPVATTIPCGLSYSANNPIG